MSQVPTDAFGRPKYLPDGRKNPNYGKDDPGEGSDYRKALGTAALSSKPKATTKTTRSKQREPHVFVNGERFGPLSKTLRWLNENATKGPPSGMGGFGRMEDGAVYFYPDNWNEVGAFVLWDPSDFPGATAPPHWTHLSAPPGAGWGKKPDAKYQWNTYWGGDTGSWKNKPDPYGRARGDDLYGIDPHAPAPPTMRPFH